MIFFLLLCLVQPAQIIRSKTYVIENMEARKFITTKGILENPKDIYKDTVLLKLLEVADETQPFAIVSTKDFLKMTVNIKNEVVFTRDEFFPAYDEYKSYCMQKKNSQEKICKMITTIMDPSNEPEEEAEQSTQEDDDKDVTTTTESKKTPSKKDTEPNEARKADSKLNDQKMTIEEKLAKKNFGDVFEWVTKFDQGDGIKIINKKSQECLTAEGNKLSVKACDENGISSQRWFLHNIIDQTEEQKKIYEENVKFTKDFLKTLKQQPTVNEDEGYETGSEEQPGTQKQKGSKKQDYSPQDLYQIAGQLLQQSPMPPGSSPMTGQLPVPPQMALAQVLAQLATQQKLSKATEEPKSEEKKHTEHGPFHKRLQRRIKRHFKKTTNPSKTSENIQDSQEIEEESDEKENVRPPKSQKLQSTPQPPLQQPPLSSENQILQPLQNSINPMQLPIQNPISPVQQPIPTFFNPMQLPIQNPPLPLQQIPQGNVYPTSPSPSEDDAKKQAFDFTFSRGNGLNFTGGFNPFDILQNKFSKKNPL